VSKEELQLTGKKKKIHMIGNAHIDPVWLWRWQEGYQVTRATFQSALDRMEETPEFIFTCSSMALYKWIEESEPEMFEIIKKRVEEGRWCIVGGWWLEPDCNIPSGEALVRQGLYGQRYLLSRFGKITRIGYNPDSFGHAGSLPQILKKSGFEYYVFMRPWPNEKTLPGSLFWWQGIDGTKMLTYRIPFQYGTWTHDLAPRIEEVANFATDIENEMMCFYGVGDHGGGPTKRNIESIKRVMATATSYDVCFSSPDRYFDAVGNKSDNCPVVDEDLQYHARGCYSVLSDIKKYNRESEEALVTAEKFGTIASVLFGEAYPQGKIQASWEDVLFNQFHDILAGTSLKISYEDSRHMHGRAIQNALEITNKAVQKISWRVKRSADGTCIIVFNPHSWWYNGPIECDLQGVYEDHHLYDANGEIVYSQRIASPAIFESFRSRMLFLASVPPMGYATYTLVHKPDVVLQKTLKAEAGVLENEYLRVEIDPETGWFKSIFDKSAGYEGLSAPGGVPRVYIDNSDTWSHDIKAYKDLEGTFSDAVVKVIEEGPARCIVRVESRYNQSRIWQDVMVYPGKRYIECRVKVDWKEPHRVLKLEFPVNVRDPKATCEIPYGFIERSLNGGEEPGQKWCDITGYMQGCGNEDEARYGLSLLNDSKYGFDFEGTKMSMTVLRSPVYSHHDPAKLNSDYPNKYTYIDCREQELVYRLLPHAGSWQDADTVKCAQELNNQPVVVIETSGTGDLPPIQSFVNVDVDNVIVSVFKKGEDDGWILRCYETAGRAVKATIFIPVLNRTLKLDFGACEIKTIKIPENLNDEAVEVNLLEFAL
jgi:alpha-mannosidase